MYQLLITHLFSYIYSVYTCIHTRIYTQYVCVYVYTKKYVCVYTQIQIYIMLVMFLWRTLICRDTNNYTSIQIWVASNFR